VGLAQSVATTWYEMGLLEHDRLRHSNANLLFTDPSIKVFVQGELDGAGAFTLEEFVSAARPKASSMLVCTRFERALIS